MLIIKRLATTVWLLACFAIAFSQTHVRISGIVKDETGQPVPYANVYIKGTMDGTSTMADGTFMLVTTESGSLTLEVSFVGYETYSMTGEATKMDHLEIFLSTSFIAGPTPVHARQEHLFKKFSGIQQIRL